MRYIRLDISGLELANDGTFVHMGGTFSVGGVEHRFKVRRPATCVKQACLLAAMVVMNELQAHNTDKQMRHLYEAMLDRSNPRIWSVMIDKKDVITCFEPV